MSDSPRMQRITLRVQDLTLALTVPATEEANYRRGADELGHTISEYRRRIDDEADPNAKLHLAMAAIDVAYRSQLWREAAGRDGLGERLELLAKRAEVLWLEHQQALTQLKQTSTDQ